MAGRFGRLELNQPQETVVKTPTVIHGEQARDAGYFMEQAQQARLWGDHEHALRMYTRTLTEDRTQVSAWVGQVQMLVQLGEFSEGRLWADKALEMFPKDGELWAAKSQCCARLGDRKAAMTCSDGSLSCPGSSPWRWIARGEVLLGIKRGHHMECFERAVTEPGFIWFDHLIIAEVLGFYSRPAAALQSVRNAITMQPNNGYCWFMQGRYQAMLGWTTSALDSYHRCLELRPNFALVQTAIEELKRASIFSRFFRRFVSWGYR